MTRRARPPPPACDGLLRPCPHRSASGLSSSTVGVAGRRDRSGSRGATDAIVLADAAHGREFDLLQTLLEEGLGLAVLRLRAAAAQAPLVALSPEHERGLLDDGGQRIRPVVAWVRHAAAGAVYSHAVRTAGPVGLSLQGAECWARLLETLAASAGAALPGRAPGFARQLVDARRHGVRVPRTVVGSDVAAAAATLSAPRVVVKVPDARLLSQQPGGGHVPIPEVVDPGDGNPDWMDGSFPAVIQEYVEHAHEFRVYYADGGLVAFHLDKPSPGSLWTDPTRVTVTPTTCPDHLAAITRSLSRHWALRYGAFDFLVTHADEPVFLEVNADGDWLWFERKAGRHPVSFMVATMVAELYARTSRPKEV